MAKCFVYLARCADASIYTGITNNLTEREKRHNAGIGSSYTKKRIPVKIVYSESFSTRNEAAKRELQIKGWTKHKKEHLITYGHPTKKQR